jgi:uncharacterized protein YwgA
MRGVGNVFLAQNLAKFRPEKYDFNLYKGFFMEKMAQICQISNEKNSKLPDFNDKIQ